MVASLQLKVNDRGKPAKGLTPYLEYEFNSQNLLSVSPSGESFGAREFQGRALGAMRRHDTHSPPNHCGNDAIATVI